MGQCNARYPARHQPHIITRRKASRLVKRYFKTVMGKKMLWDMIEQAMRLTGIPLEYANGHRLPREK